jgi:cell wall-associated NlpC family hydrolase
MRLPLVLLTALAAGACASSGAVPRPFPGAPAPTPSPARPSAAGEPAAAPGPTLPLDAYAVAGTALAFRGVPYRNGGADPSGFDCSGFVWYVFGQHGVNVPRTVTQQFAAGADPGRQLEAGDLVFFSTVAPGATHVGILIGGDEFVHAPSSTGQVRVERLSAGYWSSRFVGARRIR